MIERHANGRQTSSFYYASGTSYQTCYNDGVRISFFAVKDSTRHQFVFDDSGQLHELESISTVSQLTADVCVDASVTVTDGQMGDKRPGRCVLGDGEPLTLVAQRVNAQDRRLIVGVQDSDDDSCVAGQRRAVRG